MSSITQNIPNFLQGISQQPDKKKQLSQVNDAVNTFPDYALGMLKRPGGKLTDKLYNATSTGKWFSILRDENEKYVGQYDNDLFRIWDLSDGTPRKVDMGTTTGVPGGCNYTNLQTDLLAYNVATADTTAKTTALNTAQSAWQESDDGQEFTETDSFSTTFDYDTGIGVQTETLVDGIFQQETGDTYTIKKNANTISTSAGSIAGPVYKLEQTAEGSGYSTGIGVGPGNKIHISAAGSGYSAVSAAATSGGTGSGMTLTTTVSAGALATVTINAIGQGYKVGDELTVAGGTAGKIIVDKIVTGSVYKLAVTVGGSGYTGATGVATTGGGTALTVNTTAVAGAITAAVVNAPGNNYEINDEITVSGGGGNAKLRVVQLGYGTTSAGSGTGLVVDISTDTAHKVEPEATPSDTNTIATYTHNGVTDSSRTIGHYTNVTGTASKVGTGAMFDVDVDTLGKPTLTLVSGGSAYYAGETVTIADASLGSGGGAAIVVTISTTKIIKSGGAYTATTGYKKDEIITITGGGGNAKFKVTELTWKKGSDVTNEHPLLAANQHKIFKLIEINSPTHTQAQLTTTTSAMGTAQTNYDNAVTAEATAKGNYDSEVTACNISSVPGTAYLKDATADDIELLTLNDYTFVLNKAKTVAYTADVVAASPHAAFIVINVVAYNNTYNVTLGGSHSFSHTTPQDITAGDADATTITAALQASIDGHASYTAVTVGPGIYVTSSGAFSVSVSGGSQEDAIYAFQDQISNVGKLPIQCYNGYKVKVVNSANVAEDDIYVKFTTSNSATSGPGVWEESNAPGMKYKLDPATMPHQLVRQADGSFEYDPVTWEERDVGDEITNPDPSFIGGTIRNMFFFRNRFGFLTGDTVVMSKAASFFDFFVGSAQVAAADDPIDVSASSTTPVFLNYVKTVSAGLVLFSDNEQFLLSTDSDILSPETAKINTLAGYEADTKIEAVNLGTSLGFISKTPLWSRMFELFRISLTDPPDMFNTSGVVPELIPSTVDNIAGSAAMSIVSIGQTGTNRLYQYRALNEPQGRRASTWYKWDLTGNLIDQFFDVSTFYAVVADGSNVYVNSYDLRQASDTGFLTLPTGEKTDVCMDMWQANPYRTYNQLTGKTRVFLPFTHITGKTLTIVALGGYIGGTLGASEASVGAILYPTVGGSAGSEYVDIDGDYRGKNLIIGYIYTMTVDLPKFYPTKPAGETVAADYTSDLVLHRIKVSTGLSGPVKYNVNLTGIPDRIHTVSVIQPYTYTANDVSMAAEGVHDVPVYQRNENVSLSIVGDTPLPVCLLGMNWEGNYNARTYQRA